VNDRPYDGSDEYWDFFAGEAAKLNAPLYVRFAQGVKADLQLRALAAHARQGQPHANTLFATVHFLLLRGAKHRLRNFYPNLSPAVPAGDPFPSFHDFCLEHQPEIVAHLEKRVTNTNEVGRSPFLYAGFAALAKEAREPFQLIEIGPSAGLNFYWDRYGYRFLKDGQAIAAGAPDAKLVIETPLKGECVPPTGAALKIGKRLGLERDPVDLSNEDDRDWLKSLVWPDHKLRFERLELALAVNAGWPHDIRKGDAVELMADALAEMPEEGTLCVYHTMTIYQFPTEAKRALENIFTLASVRRPIYRLSLEWMDRAYPLALAHYRDGAVTTRTLGFCGPQGSWLEWRGLAAE